MKGKPPIESLILTIRGERVILAADLAALYGVQTKVLNQAVKRNAERFPVDFSFQLCPEEFADLKSQGIVTSDGCAALRSQFVTLDTPPLVSKITALNPGRYAKYPPYAFTEHGAIMAANEGGKGHREMVHSAFME
jgi:hypothetical protein